MPAMRRFPCPSMPVVPSRCPICRDVATISAAQTVRPAVGNGGFEAEKNMSYLANRPFRICSASLSSQHAKRLDFVDTVAGKGIKLGSILQL